MTACRVRPWLMMMRARKELSAAGFTPEVISDLRTRYEKQRATNGFTIGTHLSCLKASAAADAAYGPGFKELNEEQKYHVWNAPYTAAVTGEDAADIIDKLRSVYQKGRADKVVAPVADTKDETPGLATRIVLAAAPTGDAAAAGAAGDPDHYKPWGGAWSRRYKEEWCKRHAGQVEDVEKVKRSLNIVEKVEVNKKRRVEDVEKLEDVFASFNIEDDDVPDRQYIETHGVVHPDV